MSMAAVNVGVVDAEGGVWSSSTPTQSELGMRCRPGTGGPVRLPRRNTGLTSVSSKVSRAERPDKLAPIRTQETKYYRFQQGGRHSRRHDRALTSSPLTMNIYGADKTQDLIL